MHYFSTGRFASFCKSRFEKYVSHFHQGWAKLPILVLKNVWSDFRFFQILVSITPTILREMSLFYEFPPFFHTSIQNGPRLSAGKTRREKIWRFLLNRCSRTSQTINFMQNCNFSRTSFQNLLYTRLFRLLVGFSSILLSSKITRQNIRIEHFPSLFWLALVS